MAGLNLSSEVKVLPCPNCGQTINTLMQQCPFCATPVDANAAAASAEAFAKVNQAISDASYLKIMAGSALTFFLLMFVPFLGLIGIVGFRFLEFAIPFMFIRWLMKFGKIKSADPDFNRAKKTSIYIGGGAILFFVLITFFPR